MDSVQRRGKAFKAFRTLTLLDMSGFIRVVVKPWRAIYDLIDALAPFVFRGQADAEWPLVTSLERCLGRFRPYAPMPQNREYWMLHEFRRKFHLYAINAPAEEESFEWLSIMQHHGSPTRLLDFTTSIYIAAFFAVVESSTDAAIWAVNRYTLRDKLKEKFKLDYDRGKVLKDEINLHHIKLANSFVGRPSIPKPPSYVIPLEPRKCTDRMARQQGLFLLPTNPDKTFIANLYAAFDPEEEVGALRTVGIDELKSVEWFDYHLLKLVIPKDEHRKIVDDLTRMNLTSETLFPGLDGLARSLLQTELRR